MINLNDIVQSAAGGNGAAALGQQFGLSSDQTQSVLNSLMPSISAGLQNQASTTGGLGDLLNSITHPTSQANYNDPGAAPGASGDLLNGMFGPALGNVIQHVSQETGVSPDVLQQMLPVVVSTVVGGLSAHMTNQGFGGVLGQLANAATQSGGLGQILANGAASQQSGGGLGGILGGLLGGLFGGGQQQAPAGGAQGATVQAGLDTLNQIIASHGVEMSPSQQQALQGALGNIVGNFLR
ncbi:DUF937 domain-containing protein [Methylovirgula sp. 4M-Z18]|uniref:DUF937 domain-containing protein n=1 Tax=Methylovirgula sp. 4M-Z18 TaxID=2293567 RepID=UPI000E2FE169|nr:DUF937 domain-containing protein [Methylovirgula sp. 4M-Z18]RFB78845.1 DUF937 domain-containing protein [Methylovirgula sp. 4M-Z18]